MRPTIRRPEAAIAAGHGEEAARLTTAGAFAAAIVAAACVAMSMVAAAPAPALAGSLTIPPSSLVKSKEPISGFTGSAYGSAVVAIGDLNGDGVKDFAVGARSGTGPNGTTGLAFILRMNANGTMFSSTQLLLPGGAGALPGPDDEFGAAVAAIGDIDGDGVPDIAIGAPNCDDKKGRPNDLLPAVNRGSVYIVLLTPAGGVKASFKLSDLTIGLELTSNFARFGASIASLGNFDGAGPADFVLAVGAPGEPDADTPPGLLRGAVYELFLIYNKPAATLTVHHVVKLSDTQGTPAALHLHDADLFGGSLAALGDFDGDGIADLAVGAPLDDDNADGDVGIGANRGAVYVLLLNPDGTVGRYQKISATQGGFTAHLGRSDFFGDGVTALPDLDGNGIADMGMGSGGGEDGAPNAGGVWIALLDYQPGLTGISVRRQMRISNSLSGIGGAIDANDGFGSAVASIGDLDGDGFPDLLVGAPGHDALTSAPVWVLNLGRSTVTLASSPNPSFLGAPVQFTATVSAGGGSVGLLDGSSTVGSAALVSGQAFFITSSLAAANHPMTAAYGGDSLDIGGTSAVLNQVVSASTAVLLSMFAAEPLAAGIELRWQLADPGMYGSTTLERADRADGPWSRIASPLQATDGLVTVLDADVAPGRRYFYRLVLASGGGVPTVLGQVRAEASQPVTELSLGPVSPNPSGGAVRVEFALPRECPVRLSVLDVQGREVAMLADGVQPPGVHQLAWTGRFERGEAAAGVYFVRLQAPGRRLVRRLVLTR